VNILICIHSPVAMWTIPPAALSRLRAEFPAHTFQHATTDAGCLDMIASAEVAFMGQISPAQLAAAPRLRWLHSPAAGIGGMLFPAMLASPVTLTNSRGMSAETIAEHVLAVTLAFFRRLPQAFGSQAAKEWAQDAIGAAGNRTVAGSRVLIVGLGSIGRATARRFASLGAAVTGVRRAAGEPAEGVSAVHPPDALLDLLPGADVVVVSAPHTSTTRGLIGRHELAAMSRDAILVNVSRGQLVDEAALVDALRRGAIGGAALDVFRDEPLPPEHPLWTLPNVLITPHTAGFRTDHWDAAVALFADNLRRFDRGEPLLNVVDKQAGY
jgi:phosphoglycerate dehydrogenase-like enzyme